MAVAGSERSARPGLALFADALTAGRLVLAASLLMLAAESAPDGAAIALSFAWLSDAIDGKLARAAGGGTRLGEWDMPADTAVGAGLLLGMALGGLFPLGLAVALILILGLAYVLLKNPAFGMVLQAVGYATLLWRLWVVASPWRWLPVAVAGGIGIAERRRFTSVILPTFFRGVARALTLRRYPSYRLPQEGSSGDSETPPR
jgi:phosphatidylglycerophosphate synthase